MRCAVAVVVFLLASAAVVAPVAGQESPGIDGPESTTFNVLLEADGDARWVVEMRFTLDTPEERAAFEEYGAAFEAGDAPASPRVDFFRAAADSASQVAGREMEIVGVSRDYSVSGDTGTLELAFSWTAFLGQTENGYVLQDALRTPDGSWVESLESGQELRIHTPTGYDIVRSIEARQENDSLVIAGPESFDSEEFVVAYEQTATQSDPDTPNGDTDWGVVATGLLGLLFVVVVALVVWRWRDTEPVLLAGQPESDGGEATDAPPGEQTASGAAAGTDEADGADETAGPAVDPELLSDEERVEQLLEQNGGRMRQADIVTETDWSDAKVSQLLSRMADEGRVEKLRLGRENVISLPDDAE